MEGAATAGLSIQFEAGDWMDSVALRRERTRSLKVMVSASRRADIINATRVNWLIRGLKSRDLAPLTWSHQTRVDRWTRSHPPNALRRLVQTFLGAVVGGAETAPHYDDVMNIDSPFPFPS